MRRPSYMAASHGQVAEWLKAADCKSAGLSLRWFESSPVHHEPAAMPLGHGCDLRGKSHRFIASLVPSYAGPALPQAAKQDASHSLGDGGPPARQQRPFRSLPASQDNACHSRQSRMRSGALAGRRGPPGTSNKDHSRVPTFAARRPADPLVLVERTGQLRDRRRERCLGPRSDDRRDHGHRLRRQWNLRCGAIFGLEKWGAGAGRRCALGGRHRPRPRDGPDRERERVHRRLGSVPRRKLARLFDRTRHPASRMTAFAFPSATVRSAARPSTTARDFHRDC